MTTKTSNNLLIVMRGLPGSGKSTLAKFIKQQSEQLGLRCEIFSTDDYFCKSGEYVFDKSLLHEAHAWNARRAFEAMDDRVHVVIIDNTNIQRWHFKDYVEYAQECGYEVREELVGSLDPESIEQCHKRNVHNVPLATIARMAEQFEK